MGQNDRSLRRRARPRLEPLEGRDLPSGLAPHAAPARSALTVSASQKRFTAGFFGRYVAAPGRDAGVGERIFAQGSGGSSAFLQGSMLLRIATPTDPSGQVTGTASLYDQNYTSTGNL